MTAHTERGHRAAPLGLRSVVAGAMASAVLLGVYLGIVGFAQGVDHAFELLASDAFFVGVVALGFGMQVALFIELRAIDRMHRDAAAVTAAGMGTSGAAMLACCAHHLVDLLPLVGLSAAAVFLDAYRTPLLVVGIGMNIIAIAVIARRLRRARRACSLTDGRSFGGDTPPVSGGSESLRSGSGRSQPSSQSFPS